MPEDAYWNRWTDWISERKKGMTEAQWDEVCEMADLFHKEMTDEDEKRLARKIAKLAKKYARY